MGCTGSKTEEGVPDRAENNKSPSTESTFGIPKSVGGDDPFGQRVSSNPLFRSSAVSAAASEGEETFGFGSDVSTSSLIKAEPEPEPEPAPEPEPEPESKKSKADIKKERDLAGLAEKRKAERAAKLAAMKAKRAAKKNGDMEELTDALSIIDNLFE